MTPPNPARSDRVDDAVERWHKSPANDPDPRMHGPLHEYLGWSWDEYATYVEKNVLPPKRKGAV